MDKQSLIHMIVAMRAQIEAMHAEITAALSLLSDPDTGQCRHPPERRINITTMGGPAVWQCADCGHQQSDS